MATEPADWPAVTDEEREWRPHLSVALPPRLARRAAGPYRASVPARIAALATVPLTADVSAQAADAAAEVARFDAEVGGDIAPFSAILLRSESVASSRIENLTASARAIALAEMGDESRSNANVIVANTRAMRAAIDLADRLDPGAILVMHRALLGDVHPEWAGRWRDVQNWVGGSDYSPHGALFVPPHPEHVPAAIDDLCTFMARDDVPTMIQAAVAHAQFETIHPFPDGNGRCGRALVHSLLLAKGLTRMVTVPVSAGLLSNTKGYFETLTQYRAGNPEPIVAMLADASYAAIINGRRLVADLHQVRDGWNDRVQARRDATVWKVADLLLSQPAVDSPLIQRELGVADMSALQAIKTLVDAGVLTKVSGAQRYRRYAALEVLAQLDEFAVRAGRRGGI